MARPTPRERGEALKRAIHAARSKVGITSDVALALAAGVSYDTLMNWWGGRTTPRGKELRMVARVIGMTYADLDAIYEGRDPEPAPLQDAVADLTAEVHELVVRIDRLLTPRPEEDVARVKAALDTEQARLANPSPPRKRARPTDGGG